MVAVHVGKLHTAKELLLGQMLGNVRQVQGSLPVVALIQVVFVLEDFLGKGNRAMPSHLPAEAPHHPQLSLAPRAALSQPQGAPNWSGACCWLTQSRTAGHKSSHAAK